jgi:DNA-binding MarR family transcriptional regulator
MITVVPGITGLIDRLEAAGLVQRKRCDSDRRVVYVCVTEKAGSLLGEIDQPLIDLHQELLGHMSGEELELLSGLLEKARAPLADSLAE